MNAREDEEGLQQLLGGVEKGNFCENTTARHVTVRWKPSPCLSISFIISACLNGILLLSCFRQPVLSCRDQPTEFAGLIEELVLPWRDDTKYNTGNYTEQDLLWGKLRADSGVIALTKSYAAAHGLRGGSPFPWDSEKDIYLINGFHSIHCVSQLYLSLKEHREGLPQSRSFDHSVHCLDWLRENIMCQADDTPLYTTNSSKADSGYGQPRKCRDWSKLQAWADKRTACYRNGHFVVEDQLKSQVDRFKFCPPHSPYLARIREHYGKDDDWFPTDEELYIPH